MTEKRERRISQTTGLVDAWAGVGRWVRTAITVAIIFAIVWCAKTVAETVMWLRVLLG